MDDRQLVRLALVTFVVALAATRALVAPQEAGCGSLPEEGWVSVRGVAASVRASAGGTAIALRDASGEADVLVPAAAAGCRPARGEVASVTGRVQAAGARRTLVAEEVRCSPR